VCIGVEVKRVTDGFNADKVESFAVAVALGVVGCLHNMGYYDNASITKDEQLRLVDTLFYVCQLANNTYDFKSQRCARELVIQRIRDSGIIPVE